LAYKIVKGGFEEARCIQACPAKVDVPRYIRAIRKGDFSEALKVIREKTPFASVCGYVCPRFCEARCRRAEVDEPVAINALKRFVAEKQQIPMEAKTGKPSGQSVAIVGSGPAGLTAAYYLAKLCGHDVTVFEAQPDLGGMMRYGIPEYRLPKQMLDIEIGLIKKSGVNIKTNTRIENIDSLSKQGFNAIFIAVGAWHSNKLDTKGRDTTGVIDGLSFIREVNSGKIVSVKERVAVIGGGNVAIDAARLARRLGARSVSIIYRRSREEMPAMPDEIDQALDEGINILLLTAPSNIIKRDGELRVESVRMRLGGIDESRRRRQEEIIGSEVAMNFDTLIVAIGESPEIPPDFGLIIGRSGRVHVDPVTLATNRRGAFAGGDAISGPASVIEAIAAGRKAAINIDKYLGGQGKIDEIFTHKEAKTEGAWEESILDIPRQRMPILDSTKRYNNFSLVELGLTEEMARAEAERCLRCDQSISVEVDLTKCIKCYACQTICSFIYQRACNPENGRIIVSEPSKQIHYSNDCIGGCSLCTQYCSTGAISLSDKYRSDEPAVSKA